MDSDTRSAIGRRQFARLLGLGASAALLPRGSEAGEREQLPRAPQKPDARYWERVNAAFIMPSGFACLNAANLCPSPASVLEAAERATRSVDRDPSPQNRTKTRQGREAARQKIAAALRVSPEEIVITRNTSESNNIVSSGLDLAKGDEVLLFSDNHPSNHVAWRQKAKRFGFTVRVVEQVNPHPGADYYIEAFKRQLTPSTKVVAFTHVTSTVGDLLPARELCRIAHAHGALTLVDGAQSFGVLDVDLSDMQPDFYTGSAHKWPCGSKETGVLFVHRRVHDRIKPSIVSLYPGEVGISRSLEAFGQRDEPAIMGFGAALDFQQKVGMAAIETRARELTGRLVEGLAQIPGVRLWTATDPRLRGPVVAFQPGNLDVRRLHQALYEHDRVVCATRPTTDRGGLRFSPHFYNVDADVERAVGAVRRYMARGL